MIYTISQGKLQNVKGTQIVDTNVMLLSYNVYRLNKTSLKRSQILDVEYKMRHFEAEPVKNLEIEPHQET